MKHIFLCLFLAVALSSCSQRFAVFPYYRNTALTGNVGSPMMAWETGVIYSIGTKISVNGMLIYNGKTGSVIRIAYRELYFDTRGGNNNGISQPGSNQDLTYDLKDSKVIQFQTLKLLVDSANSSSINFRILEGPNYYNGKITDSDQ